MRQRQACSLFYLTLCVCAISSALEKNKNKVQEDQGQSEKGITSLDKQFHIKNNKDTNNVNDNEYEAFTKDTWNNFKEQEVKMKMKELFDAFKNSKLSSAEKLEAYKTLFTNQNNVVRKLVVQVEDFKTVGEGEGDMEIDNVDSAKSTSNNMLPEEQLQDVSIKMQPVELSSEEKEGELKCNNEIKPHIECLFHHSTRLNVGLKLFFIT